MTSVKKASNWDNFFEVTKKSPPRKYLVEAMKLVKNRDSALDLGAGTLRDTKFLLENNFKKVVAVDIEPVVSDFAKELNISNLEVDICSFEEFNFVPQSYDLINAQYALPFAKLEFFDEMFRRLVTSLKKDGIFVGTFFGIHDSWNGKGGKAKVFLSRKQIENLFSGFEVISLLEEEEDGAVVGSEIKHWHKFHVTAIRA